MEFLKKYDAVSGIESVVDPDQDSIFARSITFPGGLEFSPLNIAQVSSLETVSGSMASDLASVSALLAAQDAANFGSLFGSIQAASAYLDLQDKTVSANLYALIQGIGTGAAGNLEGVSAFLYGELQSVSTNLFSTISGVNSSLTSQLTSASGTLNSTIASVSGTLTSTIASVSGGLASDIASVSGNLASSISGVSSALTASINAVSGVNATQDGRLSTVEASASFLLQETRDADSLFDLFAASLGSDFVDSPRQEGFTASGGQRVFAPTGFLFSPFNDVFDIMVVRNGRFMEVTRDFNKLSSSQVEFASGLVQQDDRVVLRMERPELSTTPASYFRLTRAGIAGRALTLASNRFQLNMDALLVFRGGLLAYESSALGTAQFQYTEKSARLIEMSERLSAVEVTDVVNIGAKRAPLYRQYDANVSGTTVTVASYVINVNRLLVFREGKLLSRLAGAPTALRYTETSTTQITLAQAAVAEDIAVDFLDSVSWRQDQTTLTGTQINFLSTFSDPEKLLLFRNGMLMNAQGLGSANLQYTILDTDSVTLATSAISSDLFIAVYLP